MKQTRGELLAFLRERALAELDHAGPAQAFSSIMSDLSKEWEGQLVGYRPPPFPKDVADADEAAAMRRWIESIR